MKLKFLVGVAVLIGSTAKGAVYAQDRTVTIATQKGGSVEATLLNASAMEAGRPDRRSATTSMARADTFAALKAVESAVNAGANIETFKQYLIAAAIKVDALPWGPDSAPLKTIAQTYADAGRLFTASLTKTMSRDEVDYYQTNYSFSAVLRNLPFWGFDNEPLGPVKHPVGVYLVAPSAEAQSAHKMQRDFGARLARTGAEELLSLASIQLLELELTATLGE
jgi:hypothetical protein